VCSLELRSSAALMIGKHFIYDPSRRNCFTGIGACEVGKRNEGLPQCPTTASRPSRVIEGERCAEHVAAFPFEESPCN
jgi:hypothetical protein